MQREAEILKHTFKVKVISSKKLKKINTWIPSQLERLDCDFNDCYSKKGDFSRRLHFLSLSLSSFFIEELNYISKGHTGTQDDFRPSALQQVL